MKRGGTDRASESVCGATPGLGIPKSLRSKEMQNRTVENESRQMENQALCQTRRRLTRHGVAVGARQCKAGRAMKLCTGNHYAMGVVALAWRSDFLPLDVLPRHELRKSAICNSSRNLTPGSRTPRRHRMADKPPMCRGTRPSYGGRRESPRRANAAT
jgi:hypothetical protein